ncbi:MAG: anti-sigma factor [Chromatiales bacterium]|nr:anti-sigma factor [Chromatiales bacterium]
MNASSVRNLDRIAELLADEASAALDESDAPELKGLLERNPGVHRDDFVRSAALAQVAFLRQDSGTRMPPGLKERLASQGEALVIRQRSQSAARSPAWRPAQTNPPPLPVRTVGTGAPAARADTLAPGTSRTSPTAYLGWALAAALAVALVVVRTEAPVAPVAPDGISARASLVDEAADVITLPWAPPTAEGYEGVTGDVVWSESRQQGYLRLANMPVNDPARVQYQLWIVDPERDGKHPVDGGVFDVSSTGEVIIPIQAKLPVRLPKAFAITAEQPGGVVVSAGPLLVVAAAS